MSVEEPGDTAHGARLSGFGGANNTEMPPTAGMPHATGIRSLKPGIDATMHGGAPSVGGLHGSASPE